MGGAGVSWLELIGVIAGLTCVVMAGRNNKYNFWVGYLYNILLFMLFWQRHLYSAMLLQPIAFAINAFGHWRWTHPKEDEKSAGDASALKVSRLDMKGWCVALTFVRSCRRSGLGICPQPAWSALGSRDIQSRPDPLAGFFRADADVAGPVPLGSEEMGLLDCLAGREYRKHHPLPKCRPGVHADRQRPVPHQRNLVALDLVQVVQGRKIKAESVRRYLINK